MWTRTSRMYTAVQPFGGIGSLLAHFPAPRQPLLPVIFCLFSSFFCPFFPFLSFFVPFLRLWAILA